MRVFSVFWFFQHVSMLQLTGMYQQIVCTCMQHSSLRLCIRRLSSHTLSVALHFCQHIVMQGLTPPSPWVGFFLPNYYFSTTGACITTEPKASMWQVPSCEWAHKGWVGWVAGRAGYWDFLPPGG